MSAEHSVKKFGCKFWWHNMGLLVSKHPNLFHKTLVKLSQSIRWLRDTLNTRLTILLSCNLQRSQTTGWSSNRWSLNVTLFLPFAHFLVYKMKVQYVFTHVCLSAIRQYSERFQCWQSVTPNQTQSNVPFILEDLAQSSSLS